MNVLSSVLSAGDIIAIVSACLTFVGLIFTAAQLWRKKNVDEAKLVADMQDKIRSSSAIPAIESYLDYSVPWYDDNFHNSDFEHKMDDFLAIMNYVLFARSVHLIGERTSRIFEYDLERTVTNEDCLCYLWNLYHWSAKRNKQCPFSYLISYAKENMDEQRRAQFERKEPSGIFVKRLNF